VENKHHCRNAEHYEEADREAPNFCFDKTFPLKIKINISTELFSSKQLTSLTSGTILLINQTQPVSNQTNKTPEIM
jgi:hypothetical protein